MIISKKRIISLKFLEKLDIDKIQVGIQVTNNEQKKLGIDQFVEGIAIEPSPFLGINCNRNTNGYSYPDKTKPKIRKVVNTIEWSWRDWSGKEYSDFFDIEKDVYQKIYVKAANVELVLTKNGNGQKFIIAKMNPDTKEQFLKQTINMILEVFGFCEIFTETLDFIENNNKIKRCNWELLPPGIRVRVISQSKKELKDTKRKDFNQFRLDMLDSYHPIEIYVGTGGFTGYYAYLYDKTCYLENGFYGNATYVIPKDNWKELSQLSKQSLLATHYVIDKINHTSEWKDKIKELMKVTEGKSLD